MTTPKKPRPTRISGTWVAVLVAIVLLIFLLVFILQNLGTATVHFLWVEATLPLGVALLFGMIGGALTVALVGAARIMQLRRQARRELTKKTELAKKTGLAEKKELADKTGLADKTELAKPVPDESSSPVPPAS
ncbi:LapA family protein [Lentzea tibetensis]|uniref:LapA family protein n=1 Tax=Lentzea tibetensis TaxID=2591470 RepID=UPI0038B3BF32